MTQRNRWSAILATCVLGLLLGGAASAESFDGVVEGKVEATKTLNMEDGIRVKIQSSTQFVDRNGDKASFDDIPDPDVERRTAMLLVEGRRVNGVVQATKVKILEVIHE